MCGCPEGSTFGRLEEMMALNLDFIPPVSHKMSSVLFFFFQLSSFNENEFFPNIYMKFSINLMHRVTVASGEVIIQAVFAT